MAGVWSLSKKAADYGSASSAVVRCDRCKYMFPRIGVGGCRLVRGVIRASASCKEFTPRKASSTASEK